MPSFDRRRCYADESSKRKITDSDITDYLVKKALKLQNPNLFVWRKKIESDVSNGCAPPHLFSAKERKKREREKAAEIETLRRRREERAVRKAQHEEEMALLARERVRAELDDWEIKQAEFERHQTKLRSEIRLREGRPKPIDVLTKYADEPEGEAPCMVLEGLSVTEMEEVRREIVKMQCLERANPSRIRFWEAVLVFCECELGRALAVKGDGSGVHKSVESDVKSELEGRSYDELESLQKRIESAMQSGDAKVVEYWEETLKRLRFYKARAYLEEMHSERCTYPFISTEEARREEEKGSVEVEEEDGSRSPQLIAIDLDEEDAVDPEQDRAILEAKRIAVFRKMGVNEEEIEHDKYRLRKPKYHTRVHRGYEWNKYNQTHYDHDNPPPKTVMWYKFDVFYPDLLEKSRAPGYTVERDGENGETCIIRFHGGPPYEDIAFRIVNKEWEYSRKKGFKCTFERGILQLHFNFKRYRYRR